MSRGILIVVVLCVGCGGETDMQRYETALNVFMHEQTRLQRTEDTFERSLDRQDDEKSNKLFGDRLNKQSERVKRAHKWLEEAEAKLPD